MVNLVVRMEQVFERTMDTVSKSIILMSLLGLLLTPLHYALRTLLGMQGKIVYLLLRIKGSDGAVMTIIRTKRETSLANRASARRLFISPARQAGLSNKEV